MQTHNHLEMHTNLSNKKNLFYNLICYYKYFNCNPFDFIPLTYHISTKRQLNELKRNLPASIWIIKPGEESNRGKGIVLAENLNDLKIEDKKHTFIVQQYI